MESSLASQIDIELHTGSMAQIIKRNLLIQHYNLITTVL